MKITNREKRLIIVFGVLLIIFGYYKLVYIPQIKKINTLKSDKNEYTARLEKVKKQSELRVKTESEIKILNAKGTDGVKGFLNSIVEENIIILLDSMFTKTNLINESINFTEPTLDAANKNETDKNKKSEKDTKSSLEKIEATLNFRGSYINLLEFIKQLEGYEKKIIIKNITIAQNQGGDVAGNMVLQFYAVPKISAEDKEVIKWDFVGPYGKDNPFYSVNAATAISQYTKQKEYGFVMSVKPTSSDLPTVILGQAKDSQKNTYIYADNNGVENVEIYFTEKDGKYFYKYKTSAYSYPQSFNSNGIEFLPEENSINMIVYSNKRNSSEDNSGVNLKISNETKKQVFVKIQDDDTLRPRVNVLTVKGEIKEER